MWTTILAAAALLAGAQPQQSDTTFPVDPRGQLRIEDLHGDLTIRTWDRPQVRVGVDPDQRRQLHVDAGSSTVRVGIDRNGAPAEGADLDLTIPATLGVAVTGVSGDVQLTGVGGEVSVETVQGDIAVQGGRGLVRLRSVNGDVSLADAQGRIETHATNGDMHLRHCSGDITAEMISGDVTLEDIDSPEVRASTVSGDIRYDGSVRDGGHYVITSHSGDVLFAMPEGAGATISVSTFSGDFATAFPVRLTEQRKGQRFSFGVGSGSARVELQSFSGDIQLARHGAAAAGH